MVKTGKNPRNVASFLYRGSVIASIPHCHTEMLSKGGNKEMCLASFICFRQCGYLSSTVFHTVLLFFKGSGQRNVTSFLYAGQNMSFYI